MHRQDDEIFLIEQGAIALWTPHECRTAGPGDVVMLPEGYAPHLARLWRRSNSVPGDCDTRRVRDLLRAHR
ncbi:MAG: hypothetical protein JO121_26645 [Deltaproteobacteria bacterium]|nr:hypothetical protein [Deltaproteobacteria bacterium]